VTCKVDQKYYCDWNYYLFHYKYAIKVTESVSALVLLKADQNCLLVIIIQSDHRLERTAEIALPENAA
jgi:hypothetical protein